MTVARALVTADAPLPERAEVVGLCDRLAIAASKADPPRSGAEAVELAARLRERLWRFDRKSSDAGEALELYLQATRLTAGTAASCEADERRAHLAAELVQDPRVAYRELFLAQRRHAAVPSAQSDAALAACVSRLSAALAAEDAYRLTGADADELEKQATAGALAHARLAQTPGTAPTAASATGSVAAPLVELVRAAEGHLVVGPDAKQVGSGPVDLVRVQPFSWPEGGRVVLTLSAPTTYQLGTVGPDPAAGKGHRVYLDVARAKVKGVAAEVSSSGLVQKVRLGKRPDGTRVVLDLAASAYQKVFYLPEPFRIVIDLGSRPPAAAREDPKDGTRPLRRVALDPGHGGDDHGAVGPTGLREKDVTLDIAHRAAPALAHELGIETMLTRDNDTFVFLEERTARANAFHADLFISIHCNATDDGQARGLQVFVLDPSREMDAAARRVASRENALAAQRKSGLDPASLDAQVAAVAAGLNVGDVTQRSTKLAELVRTATFGSLAERYGKPQDHGIRTASFFVLLGAEMPATLFETAFISNPDDEALLAAADYRQKLADAIVNAVRAYREGR